MPTVEAQQQGRPPVELKVPLDEDGQVDPIAQVSWCIDPGFLKQISEDPSITDPHLLLLVCINDEVVERHLVPLDKQPLRLVFNGSGKNVLRATVVWPRPTEGRVELEKTFFDSDYNRYVKDPLERFERAPDYHDRIWHTGDNDVPVRIVGDPEKGTDDRFYYMIEGSSTRVPEDQLREGRPTSYYTLRKGFRGCTRHEREDEVVIKIDQELFAPDPPKLLKKLVELYPWWKSKGSRDQCSFRRRAMMAVPLSVVLLPLALAAVTVMVLAFVGFEIGMIAIAGFLNLCGVRNINYRAITEPWDVDPPQLWKKTGSSRWYINSEGKATPRILRAVNPLTYLTSAVLLWGVSTASGWFPLDWIWIAALPVAICIALGIIVPVAWKPLERKLDARAERRKVEAEEQEQRDRETYRQRMAELVCNGEGIPLLKNRTAWMRLSQMGYEIKDRVCKPYAQYRG